MSDAIYQGEATAFPLTHNQEPTMNEVDMSTVQRVFQHASDAIVNSSKLAQEVADLRFTVQSLQEQFTAVVAEKDTQIRNLSVNLDQATTELETVKVEVVAKDEANERLKRTVDGLSDLCDERIRTIDSLRSDNATLRREHDEGRTTISVLQERIAGLEASLESMEAHWRQDRERIGELEANERSLIAENEELIAIQEKVTASLEAVKAILSPPALEDTREFLKEPVPEVQEHTVNYETEREVPKYEGMGAGQGNIPDPVPTEQGKGDEFLNF